MVIKDEIVRIHKKKGFHKTLDLSATQSQPFHFIGEPVLPGLFLCWSG